MTTEKKILRAITKHCRENLEAFGPSYQPKWSSGNLMVGARHEADGVVQFAKEVLDLIRSMRREARRKQK